MKIQFGVSILDLAGNEVKEDSRIGFLVPAHKRLREVLVETGKCSTSDIAAFDEMATAQRKVTVGDICCRALGGPTGAGDLDHKKLVEQFDLIREIDKAEKDMRPLDLKPVVIADIIKAVEKAPFPRFWLMQALVALNGNVPAVEKTDTGPKAKAA